MKKKLALKLEELTIDSFETTPARGDAAGTVRGHLDEAAEPQPGEEVALPYTYASTCIGPTCANSCQSCLATCGYTYYPCCQYA